MKLPRRLSSEFTGRANLWEISIRGNQMIIHKYIRFDTGFVLWPMDVKIRHSDVRKLSDSIPISAGFVGFGKNGKPLCDGISDSLNLKSLPEDSGLLAEQLGLPV